MVVKKSEKLAGFVGRNICDLEKVTSAASKTQTVRLFRSQNLRPRRVPWRLIPNCVAGVNAEAEPDISISSAADVAGACDCVKPQEQTRNPLMAWFFGSGAVSNYWRCYFNYDRTKYYNIKAPCPTKSFTFGWVKGSHAKEEIIKRVNALRSLVQIFAREVNLLFEDEGVPPDITALFELILKLEDTSNDGKSVTELALSESIDGRKVEDVPTHQDELVGQIQKLMGASLVLMQELSLTYAMIQSAIATSGVILRDTPERTMCTSFMREVVQLLKRLNVAVNVFRRDFSEIAKDEQVILNVLQMSPGSWVNQVERSVDHDIYYSSVNKIDGFTNMSCVAMVRVIASICYFVNKKVICDVHNSKLSSIATDLLILAKDGVMNFQCLTQEYAKKSASSKRKKEVKVISFSRANKVKKQCDMLINWNQQFESHLKLQKMVAVNLTQLEDDDPEANHDQMVESAKKLLKLQEQSNTAARQLQKLLDVQSVLLLDLKRTLIPPDPNTAAPGVEIQGQNIKERATNDGTQVEEQSLPLEEDNTEFVNMNPEEKPVSTEENNVAKDEVYVACFRDNGSLDLTDENSLESAEDSQLGALYSGVVDQLKEALEPVKSMMLEREMAAVLKVFGELNLEESQMEKNEADPEPNRPITPEFAPVGVENNPDSQNKPEIVDKEIGVDEEISVDKEIRVVNQGGVPVGLRSPEFLAELKVTLALRERRLSGADLELELSGNVESDSEKDDCFD